MCRFLVYKGRDEILLSELILSPAHSILTQSYDSRLRLDRRRPHNGDGFGVGYYTSPALGPEPCIFTSTIPAWNCLNLERLASKTTSSLIFAHVRATTEGNLSDQNCHPFRCGSLMWMHNGGIGGWRHVKRRLASSLRDEWFIFVQGGTDSEWAFALFLDSMDRMGIHPSQVGKDGFGHSILRRAMLETIRRINALIADIPDELRTEDTRSLLNFAVTDGHNVVCTRYVSSKTDEAASLFFSSGTNWKEYGTRSEDGKANYKMERRDKGADIVLVASEPLTFERDNWVTVPTNSILTIHGQTVMIHPIIDEFYSDNPSHSRSAQFAQTKGQTVTNAKKEVITDGSTPSTPEKGRDLRDLGDDLKVRMRFSEGRSE
ncbi:N-terminal nucleophile aminohydrolase [Trichodelitschia bisporula]|uniref:N-terminal nucleophile aminohydrolase n=1 Tax=Trichodelitschia bisporula TaxID=703511 RepID=A0A6G1HRB3_9PEZI|nr:N-terminal nucleophile aminohydrolase [Trichodelitschia bisporula]